MLGDLFMLIWPPAKLWPYVCKLISFILNILMAGWRRKNREVGDERLLQLKEGDRVVWLNDKEEALHGKVEDLYRLTGKAQVVLDNPTPKSIGDRIRNIVSTTVFVRIVELIKEEHFGTSGEKEQEKIEQERPKLQDVHVSQADPSKVNRLFRAGEEIQLGSVVWVDDVGKGLVKWIGSLNLHDDILIAGLEMFEPHASCTDGSFLGKKIIKNCDTDHGLFVPLAQCRLVEQAAKQNHLLTPAGGLMHHSDGCEPRSLPSETRQDQRLWPSETRKDQQWLLDQAKRNKERPEAAKQRPGQNESTVNHHSFDDSQGRFLPSGAREDQQSLLDQATYLKERHERAKQAAGQNTTTVNFDVGHGRKPDSRRLDGQTLLEFQKLEKETRKLLAETDRRDNYTRRNGSSVDRLFPDAAAPAAEYSKHVGQMRGIESDGKSSYMEATLYSLLTFSRVLSEVLERPKMGEGFSEGNVRRSLRSIQMTLQKGSCVRQSEMIDLISRLKAVGPCGEQREPGEFLEFLLEKVLRLEPFIKFSNDQESFLYQLFVAKTPDVLPDIQDLISRSLDEANVRLLKASPCFIIQMPRYDDFKPFEYVLPTPNLDLEPMEASPVAWQSLDSDVSADECYCCGGEAELECIECGPRENEYGHPVGGTPYCVKCVGLSHNKVKRQDHHPRPIKRQVMASSASENDKRGNLKPMELFAIIAVAQYDSQYVAFVKHGSGGVAKWYFHGNTRDRVTGKNVPEVQDCTKDMNDWIIDKDGQRELLNRVLDAQTCTPGSSLDTSWMQVPPLVRRILTDGYMYIYQLPGMEMKD